MIDALSHDLDMSSGAPTTDTSRRPAGTAGLRSAGVTVDDQIPLARAALALERGDPVRALAALGTADGSHALGLRGIALAQMGELELADRALRSALVRWSETSRRARHPSDARSVALTTAARAEVALARRDLPTAAKLLPASIAALERLGERGNARYLTLVAARHALVLGQLAVARDALARAERAASKTDPPVLDAMLGITMTELALRARDPAGAARALAAARDAAAASGVPSLVREVEALEQQSHAPIVRQLGPGDRHAELDLAALVRLTARSDVALVDGCRRTITMDGSVIELARRPVLFELALALARGERGRDDLIADVFGARKSNASHRVRLRVEIGRLRRTLGQRGTIEATSSGYRLSLRAAETIVVVPLETGPLGMTAALLADGRAWTRRDIALALGMPHRTTQRTLKSLAEQGSIDRVGRGPRAHWVRRVPSIAPALLLLGLLAPR